MSKQTINIGASPNDGTGTPLRTSFDYTNQNFTEIYTALGGGVGLPGATTQVIFNDGGTNLAGDAGLVYNKTTDALTVAGLVTAGSATITGALTAGGNVGFGTTNLTTISGYTTLKINNATNGAILDLAQGDAYKGRVIGSTNGLILESSGILPIQLQVGGLNSLKIDPSGVFTFYDGAGGSGTRMTLNSTGLGIGAAPEGRLNVANTATPVIFSMTLVGAQRWQQIIDTTAGNWTLRDQTGSIDALIVKAGSGNVGIGVTPSAWNSAFKAVEFGSGNALFSGSSGYSQAYFGNNVFYNTSGNYVYKNTQAAGMYIQNQGAHQWYNAPSGTAAANITFTQAMTLDASGNLLVGKTALSSATAGIQLEAVGAVTSTRSAGAAAYFNRLTSDGFLVLIGRESSIVGDISVTTTGTTFNSTSDYRLKEAVQPLVGGLARVSALKPSVYKWKANGSAGEGFLAHELAEVVPAAVTGEKDAVNADGSIKAQSIDMSRVVPILVAAIQELTARLQTLEAR